MKKIIFFLLFCSTSQSLIGLKNRPHYPFYKNYKKNQKNYNNYPQYKSNKGKSQSSFVEKEVDIFPIITQEAIAENTIINEQEIRYKFLEYITDAKAKELKDLFNFLEQKRPEFKKTLAKSFITFPDSKSTKKIAFRVVAIVLRSHTQGKTTPEEEQRRYQICKLLLDAGAPKDVLNMQELKKLNEYEKQSSFSILP